MNNIKKIIVIEAALLMAVMSLGALSAHASEVTGTLSSSANSSGSQAGGTVGGNVNGGSTVSGTVTGGGGSTVSGTVTGGGGGGGGGLLTSNSSGGGGGGGGGGGTSNPPTGQVLGASTVAPTPGLPNAGYGPESDPSSNSISSIIGAILLASGTIFSTIHILTLKKP